MLPLQLQQKQKTINKRREDRSRAGNGRRQDKERRVQTVDVEVSFFTLHFQVFYAQRKSK